ncbi:MAG: Gfo/Idh/MocA family oxidoreductase [Butyrivibrio sp.]|nr:Gfo/Idh/MocA family oxidoreductase [Butyrivibrio sp.]
MANIKWGVLGTANIARGCTIPGMQLADNCELYAIAGRDKEKAESFMEKFGFQKAYGSYEELLADPEIQVVYIPLPNHLHREWVIKALKAGKHVLCEKPLALNEEQEKEMFQTADENGVYLMEAYAYLHSPYIQSLKKDVFSGVIGDVDYIETAFLTQGYEDDIRIYKEMGGGAMYDLGCYCTTMILSLIDSSPEYVKAVAEYNEHGADISTSAIVRFANGVRASFNVGMNLGKEKPARMDRLYIHGSNGHIISDVEYNQQGDVSYKIFTQGKVVERKVSIPQNYFLEIQQMNKCVAGEAVPFITPEFSMSNAKLMDMVLKEIGY